MFYSCQNKLSQFINNVFFTLLFSSVLLVGCNHPATNSEEEAEKSNESSQKDCDGWLDSAFDMLGPERLKISADPDVPISLLNQWTDTCIDLEEIELTLEEKQLQGILEGEILERTINRRFDTIDAMHIRDNLLYKEIAENIAGYQTTEIERVVALFNYVVRNIALREEAEPAVPLTAFRVIMFGRGAVEDRIWLFSNLMRQLKFDTVLFSFSNDVSNMDKKAYLIGVILNSGVHLFDPLMGIPIPGKADNPEKDVMVTHPATFAEVIANPELLSALDISKEEPYPFSIDILKKPNVQIIGDSSFYSDRMKALQFSLGGTRSVIMSDSLVDNDAGDGLLTRVGEAGHDFWKKEDLTNWDYYEKQNLAAYKLDERQTQIVKALMDPFDAPVIFIAPQKKDGPSFNDRALETELKKKLKGRISQTKNLLRCRIKQIKGKLPNSIKMYQNIQLVAKKENQKPELQKDRKQLVKNIVAIQDGMFWRGICSYELEDYETAFARFVQYLQLTQAKGKWTAQCRILIAQTLAKIGKREETGKILANTSRDTIYYPSAMFWNKRWNKKLEETPKEKEDSKEEKESKPETDKAKKKPAEKNKKPEVKKETKPKEKTTDKPVEKTKEKTVKTNEKPSEKPKESAKEKPVEKPEKTDSKKPSKEEKNQELVSEKKETTPEKEAEGKEKPEVKEKKS